MTSPNGGESWAQGSTRRITWTSSGNVGSNVKIELLKGSTVAQTILSSTENDGSYSSWTISSGLATGTDYRIRVTSTSNSAVKDTSNNAFSISAATTPYTSGTTRTKIGVFRPSTREFIFNTYPVTRTTFGLSSDIPITGDWNGDGSSDEGVFRPSTSEFIFNTYPVTRTTFGLSSDIPITGDWNRDGRTEIGVFRPSTHTFYQDYSGDGVWDGSVIDRTYNFGLTGDLPISGKWA